MSEEDTEEYSLELDVKSGVDYVRIDGNFESGTSDYDRIYIRISDSKVFDRDLEEITGTIGLGDTDSVLTNLVDEDYAYSEIHTDVNGKEVLVTVEDTNDGWLEWTYTAVDAPTSGTLKMTVEINYPNGFGITTFDNGNYDGWYYYDSDGIVRLGDYVGYDGSMSGYEFVETSLVTDGLRVRIKKSVLDNTFMWHGYANFHLEQNWIEIDTTGNPYGPALAKATIREWLVMEDFKVNYDLSESNVNENPICSKDYDYLSNYGVKIINPEDSCEDQEFEVLIPEKQIEGSISLI